MAYCNPGDQSYLTINNSEVIRFNGPLDISISRVDKYNGIALRNASLACYQRKFVSNRFLRDIPNETIVVVNSQPYPFLLVSINWVFRDVFQGYNRYDAIVTVRTATGGYAVSSGGAILNNARIGLAAILWGAPTWYPGSWQTANPVVNGFYEDISISFNGNQVTRRYSSEQYPNGITYSVRCNDKCPTGYQWNGKTCIWQNLDSNGNPIPNDTDNNPNTPKVCPTGYVRFLNRCILKPGWYIPPGSPPGTEPFPPDWRPWDDRRKPDKEGNCPPGWDKVVGKNGQAICRKKCKPGETRDPRTGNCCCGAIPSITGQIRQIRQDVREIINVYRKI